MPAQFRLGIEEAKSFYVNPFGHLDLATRKQMVLDVLAEVGAEHIVEKGKHEIYFSCLLPFNNHSHGDRNPSSSINYDTMLAACHVCGGGGFLWWVALVRDLQTSAEAQRWVAEKMGPDRVDTLADILRFLDELTKPESKIEQPIPVYDMSVLRPWLKVHPWLTERRHIPVETIVRLKVGYGELNIRVGDNQFIKSPRIIIPHIVGGRLHGWQSRRLLNDGTDKYISTPEMPRDSTLFDYGKVEGDVIIVESPMTVLRHSHHARLMATFGSRVTDKQIEAILRCGAKRIVLWFDSDSAGFNATEHVGEILTGQTIPFVVQCPYVGDPADLDDETFETVVRDCQLPFALWVRPTGDELISIGASNDHPQICNRKNQ